MTKKLWKTVHGRNVIPAGSVIPAGTVLPDCCDLSHQCIVGDDCTFGDNCFLGKGCTFGDDCTFGKQTHVMENCTFGQRCTFDEGCTFNECITFGKGCRIKGKFNSGGAFCWNVDPSEGEAFAGKSFFKTYAGQLGMKGSRELESKFSYTLRDDKWHLMPYVTSDLFSVDYCPTGSHAPKLVPNIELFDVANKILSEVVAHYDPNYGVSVDHLASYFADEHGVFDSALRLLAEADLVFHQDSDGHSGAVYLVDYECLCCATSKSIPEWLKPGVQS